MKLFHKTTLRQWIATLFFFTSVIIHVQPVYACELMPDSLQTTCCCGEQELEGCPMGGGCKSDDNTSDNCCTVSLTLPTESNLSNVDHAYPRDALSLNLVLPGPVLISSAIEPFHKPASPLLFNHSNIHCYGGTDTYLLTLRFRE